MNNTSLSRIRVAARLANAFALDLVKLGGFGRDVIDAVLIAAISQANVAQITRSPELQRRYATLDALPPDDLHRPVSINAIAASLHMPFETARRRIAALAETGLVRVMPKGVIVPQGPLSSSLYRAGAETHYRLVRELYRRLRAIGLLDNLPRAPADYQREGAPCRLVIRLSADYLLRLAEPITVRLGDFVTGIILMDVIHANTEHLSDAEGGDNAWNPEDFVADELRRPVRTAALSTRLGIPPETVRRHLVRLLEAGFCDRLASGYIGPARALSGEGFLQFMQDNQVNLQRLFQALAEFGVVAAWDEEIAGLQGAA